MTDMKSDCTGREEFNALLSQVLQNRKHIDTASHNGWSIDCYVGHRPNKEQANVSQIEYSAYAKTGDLSSSQVPELSDTPRAIRVDFDDTSVVTLVSDTKEGITSKLQLIFQGFSWDKGI